MVDFSVVTNKPIIAQNYNVNPAHKSEQVNTLNEAQENSVNTSSQSRINALNQIIGFSRLKHADVLSTASHSTANYSVDEFEQTVIDNLRTRTNNEMDLESLINMLNNSSELSKEQKQDIIDKLRQSTELEVNLLLSKAASSSTSSKEFCAAIVTIIEQTKTGYLNVYESVLGEYVNFYQDLSDVLSTLPTLISDGEDNKITVNVMKLQPLLTELKSKYANVQLYPANSSGTATKSEALDWADKLGISSDSVVSDGKGGYKVILDVSPIDEMISGLNALGISVGGMIIPSPISSAKYQAWKAGFDAQVEKINNQVQTLSQKYTTANSTYDNLVKVLSSTITSMYDADKEFLKN